MKRFLTIVLALCLITSLAGCGGNAGSAGQSGAQTDTQTTEQTQSNETSGNTLQQEHLIGVLVYSLSSEEVLAFQEYLKGYIEKVFPGVKFLYSEAITTPEEQLSVMEEMIDAGVEGFMAFNSYDMETEVALCEENGVYFMRPSETVTDEEFNKVKDNEYFLGVIGPGESMEYDAGYDMAEYFCENETDGKYFILSGGAPMGNDMHLQRTVGILDALQDHHGVTFDKSSLEIALEGDMVHASAGDLEICVCPGYIEAEVFLTPAQKEYEKDQYGNVLAVLPLEEMSVSVAKTQAKVGVVDCYSVRNLQLFNNDIMTYVTGKYPSIVGPAFAAMYNAVTGYAEDFRNPDGSAFRLEQGFWTSDNKEDYTDKYSLSSSVIVNAYNYEDLFSVCKALNPGATLADLEKLAAAYTYEDVLERRAADL